MAHYILQVIFFQLAFLLIYEFLLKKETFFNANRAYLLLTPVLALLLPLLKIESLGSLFPAESVQGLTSIWLPEVFIGSEAQQTQQLPEVVVKEEGFQINWWLAFYSLGMLGGLILFLKRFAAINQLSRFRNISEEKKISIIEVPNSNIACTFLNTIFLGDKISEDEKQQILSHELVHIKQKHSFDLLFFELQKIIFWFNPLIYIFQNKISVLHEFIADANVVKTTEKRSYYEQLLNTAFNTRNISFINQFFNHSLIKKRIIMLQKSRSKSIAKFKFLIIVPLMMLMLTYVACSDDSEGMNNEQSISEKLAEIKQAVDDGRELNEEEVNQLAEIMAEAKGYVPPSTSEKAKDAKPDVEGNYPYAIIEKVPTYEGCEDLVSNEERKNCTSQKIQIFVNENFDRSLGKELGLTGVNRVIVKFTIDKTGNIIGAEARAKYPELEAEAIRVVTSMPRMTPGEHNGTPANVMYSLPIVFQVGDE